MSECFLGAIIVSAACFGFYTNITRVALEEGTNRPKDHTVTYSSTVVVIDKTDTFSESGFVFAPFDINNQSILLPETHCERHTVVIESELEVPKAQKLSNSDEKDKNTHVDLVLKGISEINNGTLDKVVLSRFEEKELTRVDPMSIFKRLYNTYKNAMVYCWYHPKVGLWLGATPELLFKVEGQKLTTISLAGTQPYTKEVEVQWTNKEIEEQQIVTDYITKQIEPYTNSITISDVETVRAGNLMHLKTRIISRIEKSSSLKSIIEALHPTPAVCGFPKQKAKDFIEEIGEETAEIMIVPETEIIEHNKGGTNDSNNSS